MLANTRKLSVVKSIKVCVALLRNTWCTNLVPRAFTSTIFKMVDRREKILAIDPGNEVAGTCSVAVLSCVADMSNTFRLIICVVVSTNENAL